MAYMTWKHDVVGVAAMIGLTLGGWTFGVRPMAAQRAAEQHQTSRMAELESKLGAKRSDAVGFQAHLTERLAEIKSERIELQTPAATNARLAALARLAEQNGLSLAELRPGDPTREGLFDRVPITVIGEGSYLDVARFLRAVHDGYRDVAARGIELGRGPVESEGESRFTIELAWYAEPEGPGTGG